MAEGTTRQQSGWTLDTLHTHLDGKIDALQRHLDDKFEEADKRYEQRFQATQTAMTAALASQEKAVNVAEDVAEKWRLNANEWRGTLSDRDKKFMLEETARAELKGHETRIKLLEDSSNKDTYRSTGMKDLLGWIVGALGIGIALATLFFNR